MFRLIQDESSHWYVIPADRAKDFEDWCFGDWTNPLPEYAKRVNGSYSLVEFSEFIIK
jgi:hypothetical protein